jgi:hypothetical protein
VSDHDEPFKITGPSLDVDGKLVGRIEKVEEAGPLPLDQQPPIELGERGPSRFDEPITNFRDQPLPPSQRFGRLVIGLAVVLALGLLAGGLLFKPRVDSGLETVKSSGLAGVFSGHRAVAVIDSEPQGATVTIAGVKVGQTPWAGDNQWGPAEVTITLSGYKAWNGKLKAGEDTTVKARLIAR